MANFDLGGPLGRQALETRTILMFGEVTPGLAQAVAQQLLLLASSSTQPVKVLINAYGGSASDGEALLDVIRAAAVPVTVIGTGRVAQAATLAFAAPPRDRRVCLPHASFSLHQHFGAAGAARSAEALAGQAQALARQRARVASFLAAQTGQSHAAILAELERENWLSAEEALAHGLVDRIINSIRDV